MTDTVIVGAGKWALECWAPLLDAHRNLYRVAAVVDPVSDRACQFADALGLGQRYCFPTLATALSSTPRLQAGIVLSAPEPG